MRTDLVSNQLAFFTLCDGIFEEIQWPQPVRQRFV